MRASAAAMVPRFRQAPFAIQSERGRVEENYIQTSQDQCKDQQQYLQSQLRSQHQLQQQWKAKHSSRAELSFRSTSTNVTGIAINRALSSPVNVKSLANDSAPVTSHAASTDTKDLQASSQRHSASYKDEHCLSDHDNAEGHLAPDMSVVDGIEREIQDLADF
ncbi:hypothetical protein EC991_000911 [Linnemannia zychae]|nr:hypothetical protein EC991_000911 [Linnemannia zychae]